MQIIASLLSVFLFSSFAFALPLEEAPTSINQYQTRDVKKWNDNGCPILSQIKLGKKTKRVMYSMYDEKINRCMWIVQWSVPVFGTPTRARVIWDRSGRALRWQDKEAKYFQDTGAWLWDGMIDAHGSNIRVLVIKTGQVLLKPFEKTQYYAKATKASAVACEQQIKAAYSLVAEKAVTAFWDSESNLVPVFNVDESNNPLNWHGAARYIYFSDDLKEGEFVGMEHSQGNVMYSAFRQEAFSAAKSLWPVRSITDHNGDIIEGICTRSES